MNSDYLSKDKQLSYFSFFRSSLFVLGLILLSGHFLSGQCLPYPDAGIESNLSEADYEDLDANYNNPSQTTFSEMIAVNDGGNKFHDYTSTYANPNQVPNPFLEVTDVVRYFVQMQEDFAISPEVSQSPSLTNGVPTSMNGLPGQNFITTKEILQGIKNQGFQVHACFAALAPDGDYSNPRTFPEQWYFANEWSNNPGPNFEGVKESVKNYTVAFINTMSPPDCTGDDCIVDVFEMGNEPWGYPNPAIYHAIITGAWEAFLQEYGSDRSLWKMEFIAPSFQAFRENILECNNPTNLNEINLQKDNNGLYDLCQYDEIGEFLDLPCEVMNDIQAVNIHSYGFKTGNVFTFKTEPEHPESEFRQIKNAVIWRDANYPNREMPIYSTEFGWSSSSEVANGNDSLGQAANFLRGILIQSRYHIEKTYLYNGFSDGNPSWNGHSIYEIGDSNGIGYENAVGGAPKASFYALRDFKNLFGDKVFYKAVEEDRDGLFAYILANPDGSDPYLVFWTPQETLNNNIDELGTEVTVDWSSVFPNFALESTTATSFSFDGSTNGTFEAVTGSLINGSANIKATRMPSFIKLVQQDGVCYGPTYWETDCNTTIEVNGLDVTLISTEQANTTVIQVRKDGWTWHDKLCSDGVGFEDISCNQSNTITLPEPGIYTVDVWVKDKANRCLFTFEIAEVGFQAAGSSCDDDNVLTINDEIQADGCSCLGEPSECLSTFTANDCNTTVEVNGLDVTLESSNQSNNAIIKVRRGDWSWYTDLCHDFRPLYPCTGTYTVTVPEPGTYTIDVWVQGEGKCLFTIDVDGIEDNDQDGVCTDEDCNDDDPYAGTIQIVGSFCDDGDPTTINDVILGDGCTCAGELSPDLCTTTFTASGCNTVVSVTGLDVSLVSTDQPANTIIKVRDPNWNWFTDLCNDFNAGEECSGPATITVLSPGDYVVDVWLADGYERCTFPIVVTGPSPVQTPGTPCDDGNSETINDQIQEDGCTCLGENDCVQEITENGTTYAINGLEVSFVSTTQTDPLIIKIRTADWVYSDDLCNDYNTGEICGPGSSTTVSNAGTYLIDVQMNGSNNTIEVNLSDCTGKMSTDLTELEDLSFKIVPNPAYHSASLVLNKNWSEGPLEISVSNVLGQIMKVEQVYYNGSGKIDLAVSDFSAGNYIVTINALKNQQREVARLTIGE